MKQKTTQTIIHFLFLILMFISLVSGKSVTIGMVLDGPNPYCMDEQESFQKEIKELIGSGHSVAFPAEKMLSGDSKISTVTKHFQTLLADGDVDIVIAMGVMASNVALQQKSFPKPVIAPFVCDRNLQNAPFQKGTSGVHNLSYLDVPQNIERDINYFREMVGFKELLLLINSKFVEETVNLSDKIGALSHKLDCRIRIIPVGITVDEALSTLPTEGDAAYIAPLQLSDEEFEKLVRGLNKRKLPSFSFVGEQEVEKGIMASLNPDPCRRITRRIGINIQRILMGDDPSTFPVHYSIGERLTVNMQTARAIGFEPAWHILNQATFIGETRPKKGRELTLSQAVEEAVNNNLTLNARRHETASAKREILAAQSQLMPRLELGSSALAVEEEVAEASMGMQPQYSAKVSASVTQVLFSERANTNISVQKHAYAAQQEVLKQVKLDVVMQVVSAYYNVLRAQTFERIRQESVKRSQRYFELAKVRVSVGSANKSEIYRWESQIASNLKDHINANSQRNLAEIQLNRLLNKPLEDAFQLQEENAGYTGLLTPWQHYNDCFKTKSTFRTFRGFMVTEALKNAPEIQALDEAIAIQKRVLKAANRAFWTPTVAVQGQMDNTFYKGGKGTESLAPNPPDDVNWTLGASLTFPIYSGAEIFAKRRGHLEAMSQKELERKAAAESIEQRIRSHLHTAGASYAGITQAMKAADAAHKSLSMVKDAYAKGAVSIVHLIDAQTQAQIAEEAATDVLFDYLLKLMQVQRASGQYDFFRTKQENEDFKKRLSQSVNNGITLASNDNK